MKPLYRIFISMAALLVGGSLVFALTYVGTQTKGPIENSFEKASEIVSYAEEKIIHEKRRNTTRADELSWLKKDMKTLRNPSAILTGAFDNQAVESYKPVFELEKIFKTTFPLIQIYTAWGSKPNQKFPKTEVSGVLKTGSTPVITWEPWLSDFAPEEYPGIRPKETRDQGGLQDVSSGFYDKYLHTWAKEAANVGKPIFLRMGHEMNDPYRYPWGPQHNKPEDFIAMWRHVHSIFGEEKADNVIWVWSPHPAHGSFDAYYPGDEFVDYVGTGVLNYGKVAPWSDWWTFEEIFGQHYPALTAFGKPIMISEFGSLAVGGSRSEWYEKALTDLPKRYPLVKSVLFFHYSDDRTTTQEALNWYVRYDSATVKAIVRGMRSWKD